MINVLWDKSGGKLIELLVARADWLNGAAQSKKDDNGKQEMLHLAIKSGREFHIWNSFPPLREWNRQTEQSIVEL